MKKKVLLTIILFVFLVSSQSFALNDNGSISWQKAVSLLEQNNSTLLNMADSEKTAEKRYEDSKISSTINTDGMSISFMGMSYLFKYDTHIKLMMTQKKELFPEQMKYSWEMARDSRNTAKNSLIIGLRGLYLGLFSADNDCKIKQKKYELAQTIHKQNEIKYERGLTPSITLDESEYDLLNAKVAVNAAKRNYDNILRSLNATIGISPDITYGIVNYTEKYDSKRLKTYSYYAEKALSERLDIVSAEKQIYLMEKNKSIMESIPNCLNITSVGKDYADLLKDIDYQKIKLESERLDVEMGIKSAYSEVSAAGKSTTSLKKVLDLRRSSLDNTKKRFQAGLISKTILDEVQIGYEEFENTYKAAMFDYNTKLMKLEYAAGIGPAY